MSEERPEEQMGSESEDPLAESASEEPIDSGSAGEPMGDTTGHQFGTESEDASAEDVADQQIVTDSADPSAEGPDEGVAAAGEEGESAPPGEAIEPSEESRFGSFLKRALRWVVVVLVIFTLGIIAMQLVRVGPLIDERNSLQQSLAEAQETQQDLQYL